LPPPIEKGRMIVINLDWHRMRKELGMSGLKEGAGER
jgi:hypothetical protein